MVNQPLACALICLFLSLILFFVVVILCYHPEALLKQRTPPWTHQMPSARSGSLNTFLFD